MVRLSPVHLPVLLPAAVVVDIAGSSGTDYTDTAVVEGQPRVNWYGPAREHRVALASSPYRSATEGRSRGHGEVSDTKSDGGLKIDPQGWVVNSLSPFSHRVTRYLLRLNSGIDRPSHWIL